MGISRRVFLHAAGLGATAAALSACTGAGAGSGGPAPAPTRISLAPPPTTTTAPIDYRSLAGRLSGPLRTPGQAGYETASTSYNPLYDGRRPAAIALCARAEDVRVCVSTAAAAHVPVAARSGGHSYAGYSTPDNALVIDLSGLSGVRVAADGTAVIGAGTRLIDVYAGLAAAGRCLPAGSCPTVGVGGMTLGGGVGVLARKFGLTCDRLVAADVVTADSTPHTVSATADSELFWALRGGGGGNFGVVTSFSFATAPAPAELTAFSIGFPAGSVPAALGGWQRWLAAAPDELWANCNITGGTPSTCTVGGCFVGSPMTLNPMLDNLVRMVGARPTYRIVRGGDYLDTMRYFAGCVNLSNAQCRPTSAGGALGREAFAASSRILTGNLDPARVASICDGRTGLHVIFDGLGGAVGRIDPAATAFPHRTAQAIVQIYLKTSTAGAAAARQAVREVRDDLGAVLGSGGYVNYIDPTMPNWGPAYYGANLPRLRQVAQRYDPNAMFGFAQSVSRA